MTRLFSLAASQLYLIFIFIVFCILRFPSLFEPYWYGDEGIYQVIGKAINNGRVLYTGIFDNKPPLLYYVYALADGDQFTVRLISLLFGLASVVVFYFLARKLFSKNYAVYISTTFFAFFFGLPIIEGNIANAENFMIFPILAAGLLIVTIAQKINTSKHYQGKELIAAGFLLGVAFLFKIVGIFDFLAFALFLFLVLSQKKSLVVSLKEALPIESKLLQGFVIPLGIAAIVALAQGSFSVMMQASFLQNVGYVGYGNSFFIPQGFLIAKSLVLVAFLFIIFFIRKRLTLTEVFVLVYLAFSLFNAFFSQRPYTHYQLVLLPSLALLAGCIDTLKRKRHIFYFVALVAILILVDHSFDRFSIKRTVNYYKNFVAYTTNNLSQEKYWSSFDSDVPRVYLLADYLKAKTDPKDSVLLWGNTAQIYALSETIPPGRFTVAYHVSNDSARKETENAIRTNPPKYVIFLWNAPAFPFQLTNYHSRVTLEGATVYEKNN